MWSYILKRLLLMIPTMVGIIAISFFIVRLAPGEPSKTGFADAAAGINAERGTAAAEQKFRERHHFDKPLPQQFVLFLNRLVHGDLVLYQTEASLWERLGSGLRVTVQLNLIVFLLIYALAIPSGIYSAAYPRTMLEQCLTLGLFILYSIPPFWMAEMLRMVVSSDIWKPLGISGPLLPILNLTSGNYERLTVWQRFWDYLAHIVLPVGCMTYTGIAYISRQMRTGMLEVIRQDYIRTAEAKGCSKSRVILVHALRNSLFPIITLLASLLPMLVGGSVIIEVIFQIQGMGLTAYQAVTEREYDLVMITLILSAVLTLLGVLVSDVLYVIVNPRVSFDESR